MRNTSIVLLLLMLMAGCGRSEEKGTLTLSENMQRLTNGEYKDWRLQKATYYKIDVSGQLPECQRDEIFRFYADGKGEVRSGAVACTDSEPEVQATGRWELNSTGDTMLVEWKQKTKWQIAINKLEPDQLVTTGEVFDNYSVTATFSAIN